MPPEGCEARQPHCTQNTRRELTVRQLAASFCQSDLRA
jgi:hypothetical protein